jgi:hypothetical protein
MRRYKSIQKINESYVLPEDQQKVIFLQDFKLRPNKLLEIQIQKGTVATLFMEAGIRKIYIKGLDYLIEEPLRSLYVIAKSNIRFTVWADFILFNNKKKYYNIYNDYDWYEFFPLDYDDESTINAGKDMYILFNASPSDLNLKLLRPHMKSALSYCEQMEYYEQCAELVNLNKPKNSEKSYSEPDRIRLSA